MEKSEWAFGSAQYNVKRKLRDIFIYNMTCSFVSIQTYVYVYKIKKVYKLFILEQEAGGMWGIKWEYFKIDFYDVWVTHNKHEILQLKYI